VRAPTDQLQGEEFGLELAEILAEAPRSGTDPSPRLLDVLVTLGEAPAGILVRWDPHDGRCRAAAVRGYPAELVDHLVSGAFQRDDPAYRAIVDDPQRPLRCWRDLDFDYATTWTAREFLVPSGYRGGVSLRLVTSRGRYVGDLHMSTEDRRLPSPAAMRLLHRSRTILAASQDVPPVSAAGLTTVLPDAEHVALVRRDGSVQPLDGQGLGPMTDERTGLLDELRGIVRAAGPNAPDRSYHWLDGSGSWHHVRVRPVRGGAIVSTTRAASPHGLSRREMEILDRVCGGHSNLAIARQFRISERTVAHHVERIFGKLQVGSRAAAVALAEQDGLRLLARPGWAPRRAVAVASLTRRDGANVEHSIAVDGSGGA
jgi:DNA-binding CsgD family transcriptional regulator